MIDRNPSSATLPTRRRRQFFAASLFVLGCTLAAWSNMSIGHEYQAGSLKIEHPWSRATAAGASVGGYFLVREITDDDKGSAGSFVLGGGAMSVVREGTQ